MIDFNLYLIMVDRFKTERVLELARDMGMRGSTIMPAQSVRGGKFLKFLGLDRALHDVVMIAAEREAGDKFMAAAVAKFVSRRRYKSMGFVVPLSETFGIKNVNAKEIKENKTMSYKLIMTIVDRGRSDDVIEAGLAAGAKGATILHGRGSGANNPKLFNFEIEPEKEAVFILTSANNYDAICQKIRVDLQIDQPNKGIIFVLDVAETFGLYEG